MKYILMLLGIGGVAALWNAQKEEPAAPPPPDLLPPAPELSPAVSLPTQAATAPPIVAKPRSKASVFPLKLGSQGKEVGIVQKLLGLKADGVFGPATQAQAIAVWGVRELSLEKYQEVMAKVVAKKAPNASKPPAQATQQKSAQTGIKAADVFAVFNAIYRIGKPRGNMPIVAMERLDIDSQTVYKQLYEKPDEYLRAFQRVYDTSPESPNVKYGKKGLLAAVSEISHFSSGYNRKDWIVKKLKSL